MAGRENIHGLPPGSTISQALYIASCTGIKLTPEQVAGYIDSRQEESSGGLMDHEVLRRLLPPDKQQIIDEHYKKPAPLPEREPISRF